MSLVETDSELVAWGTGLPDEPRSAAVVCERLGLVRLGPWFVPPGPTEDAVERALRVGLAICDERNEAVGAGVAAVAVATAIERGLAQAAAGRALLSICYVGWGRGRWWLRELGSSPAGGSLAREADVNAERFALDRIALVPPVVPEPASALLGPVDGDGRREVRLTFRTVREEPDIVAFRLRDGHGVEGAILAFEGDEIRLLGRRRPRKLRAGFAPCDPSLAREVVADALVAHLARGRPLPATFFLARPYLGPALLEPRRRRPRIDALLLDASRREPGGAGVTKAAPRDPAFSLARALEEIQARAIDFVAAELKRLGRRRAEVEIAEPLNAQIAAGLPPADRDRLLARLAANLEVEALRGRARDPATLAVARSYVLIREGTVPIREIDYVCWLIAAIYLAAQRDGKRPRPSRSREEPDRTA